MTPEQHAAQVALVRASLNCYTPRQPKGHDGPNTSLDRERHEK